MRPEIWSPVRIPEQEPNEAAGCSTYFGLERPAFFEPHAVLVGRKRRRAGEPHDAGSNESSSLLKCAVLELRPARFEGGTLALVVEPALNPTRRIVSRVVVAVGIACAAMVGGCGKPIFTPDEPRSQFDRVQAVRDRRVPTRVMDEFGNSRPNIRGRLLSGP